MPRALWSGAISFGLVNVPVRLFSAVSPKEVHFHLLHRSDGARIQMKRVCSIEGKEVPYDDIIKGFEVAKNRYIPVDPEELAAFDPRATHTIDIEDFVELGEIDPIYYEHSYYLVPDKRAGKAYQMLLRAMQRTNKVAVCRMVLRTKQYLCALRPVGNVLMVTTMQYADEIVSPDTLDWPENEQAPRSREVDMAEQLIESLTAPFRPERYRDEYRDKVLELLQRKAKGEEIVAPEPEEEEPRVKNLADALAASLANARGSRTAAARPRTAARATRRAPTEERAAAKSSSAPRTKKKRSAPSRAKRSTSGTRRAPTESRASGRTTRASKRKS